MVDYPNCSWQQLLKGGFCFGLAHFACHPLDRQRAEEMFYKTKVNNVDLKQVLKETKHYLKSKNCSKQDIVEKVREVEDFYNRMNKKEVKKKDSAWLITWEDKNSNTFSTKNIISIRDARISGDRIADFIEQYYISTHYATKDKFYFSSRLKLNPYPAIYSKTKGGVPYMGSLTCGDNPYIHARLVKNLKMFYNGIEEKFEWDDIDYKNWSIDK